MDEIRDSDGLINLSVGIYLFEISKRRSCSHLTDLSQMYRIVYCIVSSVAALLCT